MEKIRVGILGLGTVGCGTVKILARNSSEISRRTGRDIMVTHAAVRNLKAKRSCDTQSLKLGTDVMAVATNPDIDILVELIGGTGLAYDAVKQAIISGKNIVTANKALIATHGNELFQLALEHNVSIAFEATVAGGVPIIKAIREGLTANKVLWLAGIINGTGNFILTEMKDKGRDFAEVLAEAQELGYAEADPTFDVEGIDAAHKLAILAAISFGIPLQFDKVYTEGISKIKPEDVSYADELGYNIKHLGIAKQTDHGVELRVHPTLVPKTQLLANVDGIMNAVLTMSDAVGYSLYYGSGAGSEPTASAVIADIVDIVRTINIDAKAKVPALAFQSHEMSDAEIISIDEVYSSYYIRAKVVDKPGVLAKITTILAEHDVSIEAFIQKDCTDKANASVVVLTHVCKEADVNAALDKISGLDETKSEITKIRMESLDR